MRGERAVSSLRSVVEGLRASPRRVWWTSFVLVTLLIGVWSLANPPFAAPDEPSHVIRSVALDHGQLTGKTPSPQLAEALRRSGGGRKDFLTVRAPETYQFASGTTCFTFHPKRTAACLEFGGSRRDTDVGTYVAKHPPAYYAVVGVASWIGRPGSGPVYAMRFIGVLISAAFIATAITALRRSSMPRLVAVGLAIAITPMVLFVTSVVNPSAPEIAAALALWVCGLLLVAEADKRIDNRLVTAVGIAGSVVALSRQLGPLWLGLIALTLLAVSSRRALHNLARSNRARLWGLVVVACGLAQLAWDVIVKPLDVSLSGRKPVDLGATETIRTTLGLSIFRYRDMIGNFGWLDTPTPGLTWIPWTAAVAFLFFAAVVWVNRRHVAVLLALLGVTIIVPVIIESSTYDEAGGVNWQGRYTLPLAVGIPILAAIALASTERDRKLVNPRLVVAVGAVLGVGHILAFAQNLRRYTVGADGPIQFWKDPGWAPPLSPLLLTIVYVVAVGAFMAWLLAGAPDSGERDVATPGRSDERTPEESSLALRQA